MKISCTFGMRLISTHKETLLFLWINYLHNYLNNYLNNYHNLVT